MKTSLAQALYASCFGQFTAQVLSPTPPKWLADCIYWKKMICPPPWPGRAMPGDCSQIPIWLRMFPFACNAISSHSWQNSSRMGSSEDGLPETHNYPEINQSELLE